MKIAIDISQIAYEGTGVASYVKNLITNIVTADSNNEYILFGASLRKRHVFREFARSLNDKSQRVRLISVPIPPTILAVLWNTWHVFPAEWFVGDVDIFWSSDWTQPPLSHAIGMTTVHDLSTVFYPLESHSSTEVDVTSGRILANITGTQAQRLRHVQKECRLILSDSESTKRDLIKVFHIPERSVHVVYPAVS